MTAEKFDVYTHVTNQIIAQIEAGTPPWRKPWTGGGAGASLPERFNGAAYQGINILMLWATAMAKDYSSARWMTFNQAKQFGDHIRKSEKSATVERELGAPQIALPALRTGGALQPAMTDAPRPSCQPAPSQQLSCSGYES